MTSESGAHPFPHYTAYLFLICSSNTKITPRVSFPASLSQVLFKRPETLSWRPHSSRAFPGQASVPGHEGGVTAALWPSLRGQWRCRRIFFLWVAWGEVPRTNRANNPHLLNDRSPWGENTRGFPSPGPRSPSKAGSGRPSPMLQGPPQAIERRPSGFEGVLWPAGLSRTPTPTPPPPPVPAVPSQDPPAASGPPPIAPRSGTAAAQTRSGWFSPPPPPARGGSRRRRGYHRPPARAAARAPSAAGRPRPSPSPAEPRGHPPRAGSCPAGSPGSKSWSAGLRLQDRAPCAGRAEVKCGDVRGTRH